MTDIVERLRARIKWDTCVPAEMIMADAANEITILRQQLAECQAKRPDGCEWVVTKGGHSICQPPKATIELRQQLAECQAREKVPTTDAAYSIGATGGPYVEAERLAFEAWMKGHCWALNAEWTTRGYVNDSEIINKTVDQNATRTRQLWAAWRDRAALALPSDATALDTMLKQAKREALLEAADFFQGKLHNCEIFYPIDELRCMAKELE